MTEKFKSPEQLMNEEIEDASRVRQLNEQVETLIKVVEVILRLPNERREQALQYLREEDELGAKHAKVLNAIIRSLQQD